MPRVLVAVSGKKQFKHCLHQLQNESVTNESAVTPSLMAKRICMEAAKQVAAATIKPAADKDVTFIALQSKDLYPPLYLPLIIPGRRTNVCCLCMPVSSALLLAIQIETVD